jgi:hypothetical protein
MNANSRPLIRPSVTVSPISSLSACKCGAATATASVCNFAGQPKKRRAEPNAVGASGAQHLLVGQRFHDALNRGTGQIDRFRDLT